MAHKEADKDNYKQQFETITSPARMSAVLRPLLDKHTLLTIIIPGVEKRYTSAFLSFDIDKQELLIDELHPEDGHKFLTQSGELKIYTQLDGVDVNLKATVLNSDIENGIRFYILKLPESIQYRQRRDSYRVNVSSAKSIPVEIKTTDNKSYHGELQDISAGGLCVRFPAKSSPPPEIRTQETQCTITLLDKRKIQCALYICHTHPHEASGTTHVGGRFEHLDKIQHRTIERFVVELQRKSRQNDPR